MGEASVPAQASTVLLLPPPGVLGSWAGRRNREQTLASVQAGKPVKPELRTRSHEGQEEQGTYSCCFPSCSLPGPHFMLASEGHHPSWVSP